MREFDLKGRAIDLTRIETEIKLKYGTQMKRKERK